MWISLFFVSCTSLLVKGFGNEDILGNGRWLVLNVLPCEEPEQFPIQLGITRKKINRTHDAFSLHTDLDRALDFTIGIEIVIHKEVDGGFKYYQTISDESFCKMATIYLGNNWMKALAKGNIDPPQCPIPKGEFIIDDYVLDYQEMIKMGMYGKYDASAYVTHMGQRIGCTRFLVEYDKQHEDDDDGDDYPRNPIRLF